MFDTLKAELVNDPLIAGQPDFAQKWLQRVGYAQPRHQDAPPAVSQDPSTHACEALVITACNSYNDKHCMY